MRAAAVFTGFLSRAAATAFLCTVAAAIPSFRPVLLSLAVLFLLVYIASWILDDWLMQVFRLEQQDYYAALVMFPLTLLLGGGLALWIIL